MTNVTQGMEDRDAFEAWSRKQLDGGFTLDRYNHPDCNEYVHWGSELAWRAWQAAVAVERERIALWLEANNISFPMHGKPKPEPHHGTGMHNGMHYAAALRAAKE